MKRMNNDSGSYLVSHLKHDLRALLRAMRQVEQHPVGRDWQAQFAHAADALAGILVKCGMRIPESLLRSGK
jgi:hypothetical protein